MAGFGRTGEWFAADHFDVVPDLLTFAKGVNSGYVPLGGVAISGAIAETFAKPALPGRTHVLRAPAGLRGGRRDDQRDGRGGRRRERRSGSARPCSDPGLRELAGAAPVGRRGARHRHVLGARAGRNRETREPLVPYNATGEANAPMAAFGAAVQEGRAVAVREHEPHPRRAALQRHRGRGQGGPRGPGRGPHGGRRVHRVTGAAADPDAGGSRRDPRQKAVVRDPGAVAGPLCTEGLDFVERVRWRART